MLRFFYLNAKMQKFTTYIILFALLACGILLIYRSYLSANDFIQTESRVVKKQIEITSYRKGNPRYGITFQIDDYEDKLGIYFGTLEQARNNVLYNLIEPNKTYTFYIDPTVSSSNGINLGIREIRFKGRAIYKESQKFTLFLGVFLTLLCLVGWFLISKFNRNKKDSIHSGKQESLHK